MVVRGPQHAGRDRSPHPRARCSARRSSGSFPGRRARPTALARGALADGAAGAARRARCPRSPARSDRRPTPRPRARRAPARTAPRGDPRVARPRARARGSRGPRRRHDRRGAADPHRRGPRSASSQAVVDEALGLGPLEAAAARPRASPRSWSAARAACSSSATAASRRRRSASRDDAHLLHVIDRILAPLGRRVDEASPMVDARLPDGSRVNAVIPPLALDGPALTIRRFGGGPLSGDDLVRLGTIDERMLDLLRRGRPGAAQRAGHGRHGQREDDDPRGARRVRAAPRAHRHDRGRGRAAHRAAARRPTREPAAVAGGRGRGADPGAGAQRPPHAPRSDRGRRGPRRRRRSTC